ncbi:MAG: MATE family efflux transporter [Campylobacter sp.]|nr:MATE family efflux transporter [Campylobacter sp.]
MNISLFKLFLPIYIDMMLRLATIFINTYMISRINVSLVGAMGAGNQIFTLFVTICNFLAVGCSVVVAQAIGAKRRKLAIRATHISIAFNAIIGLISGIVVHFYAKEILHLLQIPDEVLEESYHYLKILAIVFAFDAVAIVGSTIVRVYNHATSMMVVTIIMNIMTVIMNYLVLFEPFGLPYLGLEGVAYSTAIGRFFGVFMIMFVLVKIVGMRIYPRLFFRPNFDILRKILRIGLPSAGENLLWIGQYMVAFSFVASMGELSLTVQTIYFQISSFIFFFATSLSIANEVIIGRMVGAKMLDTAYNRAFKTLKIGLFCTAIIMAIVFLSRYQIMDLLSVKGELASIMLPLFTLSIFLELARAFNIIMVNSLRASGDAKFPFYMGIIFMWGVSLPLGYFLGIHLEIGILGVWMGFLADEFLRGFCNTLRWRSKAWQSKTLV